VYRQARGEPRWWWQVHQVAVSAVYMAMLYPGWLVRNFLPAPWGMVFFLVLLAVTAAATTLRLNLWFVSRFFPGELPAQRRRSRVATVLSDLAFAISLLTAAFVIAGAHPEFAVLLVAVSVSTLIVAFVIEPTTARVAFPPVAPTSSSSSRA
jgi:hypothetical protein